MTNEQIELSLETAALQMGKWEKFTHFQIVGLLLVFLPAMLVFFHLKDYFGGTPKPFREIEVWLILASIILGLLFYLLQKKRLRFIAIDTRLKREQLEPILEALGNELGWTTRFKNEKAMVATSNPAFFSGSWGEQITILFDRDRILANSICDPNKTSSLLSMGRNKRNINRLAEAISMAERTG